MAKSWEEINARIASGEAVVVTAEEFADIAKSEGVKKAAKRVDVVTTGTFGPMCSSGVMLNFGHSDPPIRMARIWLNDVPAYGGLAAVDTYLGVTEPSETRGLEYGGAHVIEDLLRGKRVHLRATSPGTDCYPRNEIDTWVGLEDLNQAYFFNPRNAYQNYAVAVNSSDRTVLHVPRPAAAALRERHVLLGGSAVAAAQRPHVPHDRRRDTVLRRGRAGLRGMAGHAAQPQPEPRRARRAYGARRDARGHRRHEAGVAGVLLGRDDDGVRREFLRRHRHPDPRAR